MEAQNIYVHIWSLPATADCLCHKTVIFRWNIMSFGNFNYFKQVYYNEILECKPLFQ